MMRRIAIIVYPGFQLLDATGPIATFDLVRRYDPQCYEITLLSAAGGRVASSAGVAFDTQPLGDETFDTIIVAGGELHRRIDGLKDVVAWLRWQAPRSRRTASVSSGAFMLAEAGLLQGRRATTHWAVTRIFTRLYPEVRLNPDRIYIKDGSIWTSGGTTAGIDLTLALIEEDLGADIARRVAQVLVVHQRRPGGQSQHSALLEMDGADGRFADLIDWMRNHLSEALPIERLAAHVAMSPRHFARAFTRETGITPAKAVERFRIEAARTRIETGHMPIDHVAEECGFGEAERMRRAFLRVFGLPPQAFRRAARLRAGDG